MRFGPVEISSHAPRRELDDILRENDVVKVTDYGIIVAPKLSDPRVDEVPASPDMRQLGSSATRWRRALGFEEYNADLRGAAGYDVYDQMRRSDGTVRQALRIAKTPVLAGRWYVASADPLDDQANDIAEFVDKALFDWQTISWYQILTESLLMLDFGYYFFEKIWTTVEWNGELKHTWKKWLPMHPIDVREWKYDKHGGPDGVYIGDFEGEEDVWIPISKLLVFSYDRETGNVEGISMLRALYKHWYYKDNLYKIDAIQKERHGIGIPIIHLPPNFTDADLALAEELGRNLRTNEQAHVVLPPLWKLEFADIKGNIVNVIESIDHHDSKMLEAVLAGFEKTNVATAADQQVELFLKAVRYIADIVRDVINKHAIPELVKYNWKDATDKIPELKVRRIGETTDWRTLSFAIRNLTGAGVIRPDDDLEAWARDEMDLPLADPDTAREVATPQAGPKPPRVGQPRQSQPSAGQGAGTGEDKSGGN
jgi:hypothetical protein